ncbi:MAG TPA: hypothetical protein VKR26_20440 [Terriglobales bacterium]|jgi:hypothetical protein|nr:hypothetical protein [Terriglobales bacterium]
MVTIVIIGTVTALAMFAILMKLFAGDPPEAEKLQKGDIIKQLLALSELESRTGSKSTPPARPRTEQVGNTTRPAKGSNDAKPIKEKTSECLGC